MKKKYDMDGVNGEGVANDNRAFGHVGEKTGLTGLSGAGDMGSQAENAGFSASVDDVTLKNGDLQNGGLDSTSRQDLIEEEDEEETSCQWGPLRPGCCRVFTNVKAALFILCCAAAVQGCVVNGFVNVSISSIEKRFDLESKDAGLAASFYDIASVLCLIPVGYFGGQGSKPRWLGFGVMLMGVGSIVFALPHFLTATYEPQVLGEDEFCDVTANATSDCTDNKEKNLWRYKYMLYFGQFLHGAGAAPLYTLGVTYLDENLKPKMSAIYVSIYYAMSIVGPALGYVMGGFFLSIFTDFHSVKKSELEIDAESETWVGAWWLGPLMCGGLAFIISIPLLGFPRRLPGWQELKKHKENEAYSGREDDTPHGSSGLESLKHFPATVKSLFTNPTFIFLNLAGGMEGILVSGFSTFLPKYLESQFSLTASMAALYVGAVTVPAGGGGMFVGGYIIKRFNLRVRGCIIFSIALTVLVLFMALAFLVRCPNVDFAGVNIEYGGPDMNKKASEDTLAHECNRDCGCTFVNFKPICGNNDIMYFNPCAAGCLEVDKGGKTTYENCTCISWEPKGRELTAKEGKCDAGCNLLPLFLPFMVLIIFCTFATDMPALSATLRCVPERHRSFAVSIQWIFIRCLGSIPGPIIFGAVIDETCLFWKESCSSDTGACYFYDNDDLSTYMMILGLVCKTVSTIFFTLAAVLYKPPPEEKDKVETNVGDTASDAKSRSASAIGQSSLSKHSLDALNEKPEMGDGDVGMVNLASAP